MFNLKKIKGTVALLLILSFALSVFAGCATPNEPVQSTEPERSKEPEQSNEPKKTDSLGINSDISVDNIQSNNTNSGNEWVSPIAFCQGLDEYIAFINEHKHEIPNYFLTLDDLLGSLKMGQFLSFQALSRLGNNGYKSYYYTFHIDFKGDRDSTATLYVYHDTPKSDQLHTQNVIFNIPGDNLLACPNNQSGVYSFNGVDYWYSNGNLFQISWTYNNTSFVYYRNGGEHFNDSEYTYLSDSIKMLCTKSGAAEAVKLFDEMINEAK